MSVIKENVKGLYVSLPKSYGEVKTSMIKNAVKKLVIKKDHLVGDEVADKKHHGGPDRVIHHYSIKNYEHLKSSFPKFSEKFLPGTYGENLLTEKMTELDVCIGDIFQLGSALIQVSEPRQPCSTIDFCYGEKGVLKEVFDSRKFGWLYRVLEEGEVKMGEELILKDRLYPEVNLDRFIYEVYQAAKEKDIDFLRTIKDYPELSVVMKKKIHSLVAN